MLSDINQQYIKFCKHCTSFLSYIYKSLCLKCSLNEFYDFHGSFINKCSLYIFTVCSLYIQMRDRIFFYLGTYTLRGISALFCRPSHIICTRPSYALPFLRNEKWQKIQVSSNHYTCDHLLLDASRYNLYNISNFIIPTAWKKVKLKKKTILRPTGNLSV